MEIDGFHLALSAPECSSTGDWKHQSSIPPWSESTALELPHCIQMLSPSGGLLGLIIGHNWGLTVRHVVTTVIMSPQTTQTPTCGVGVECVFGVDMVSGHNSRSGRPLQGAAIGG